MKKIIVLIIALSTLLSLASCSDKGKNELETTTPVATSPETTPATTEPPAPPAVDDGVRVHSWISQSYTKNLGHDIVNDKGNIYDFKDGYGTKAYRFDILKRSHADGSVSEYKVTQGKCLYDHVSTIYGNSGNGLIRVDHVGDGSRAYNFNEYSNPGVFYILPEKGYDIIIAYTVKSDGTYNVRAAAQRTHGLYQSGGYTSTGSRFFIEHNGEIVCEETDFVEDGKTKHIEFCEQLELKKGDTVYFGHDPIDDGDNPIVGNADDSVIKYFYLEKVGAEEETTSDTNEISLQMAKNELESFHISVNSPVAVEGLTLNLVSAPVDNLSLEYLEEHTISTNNVLFPDPITVSDGTFNVKANETKSMLVRFGSNKETKAGEYTYVFELRSPSGWVLETFTVNLKVWNFSLPDELGCDTAGDLRENEIIAKEGITPEALGETMYKQYYDMLIEYNFSAHDLPYDILDERADAYMSNPHVTGFRVDYNFDDEKLIAINEKLKSNPVWLEKAYFYIYDEPNDVAALNVLKGRVERLNQICPDIDVLVAFFRNVNYDGNRDQIEFMDEYCDVFCAKSACWRPGWLADPLGRGYFGDRMDALKTQGNKIWWYVCWEPVYPYCNLQVNELGLYHRQLFWQQYFYNSDGLLYWSTTYWGDTQNPWEDIATVKSLNKSCFGDGSLLYPGKPVGVDGPVASLRLECVRNGTEDFDMLRLAEEHLGREWVDTQIKKVTTTLIDHSDDDELFAKVRKLIGDELEKAINK